MRVSGSTVARFLQEAQIIATIQHPNVIQLLDAGKIGQHTIYIAMELLHGRTLLDILRPTDLRGEVLDWKTLAPMMLQICEGLRAVHQLGVVHRDMKPSNCFCIDLGDGRQHMKVLDFGISKMKDSEAVESTRALAPLTAADVLVGTPHYIAPEVIRGGDKIDARADIYAVGVILYRCVTGTLPFGGNNRIESLYRAAHESPQPPSERLPQSGISRDLDALILRAMANDPGDRYSTMVELIDAITELSSKSGVHAQSGLQALVHRPVGPRPTLAAGTPLVSPKNVPESTRPLQGKTDEATGLVPVPPARHQAPPRRLATVFAFATRSARNLIGFLGRRILARNRRTRPGTWRSGDPGISGHYRLSKRPWSEMEALLTEHDFDCSHEEARYIVSFLKESFSRFRRFDERTIQLDFIGSEHRASTIRWEHYCIIITNEFVSPAAKMGTTFVERLINIEPLLHAIRRNVRKTIFVITRSDRIGRGLYEKIARYREEHDIYIVPILVTNIIDAHKQRAGSLQGHLIQEFNRLHPGEVRMISSTPKSAPTNLAEFYELIGKGSAHLTNNRLGVLLVCGMPLCGKTSVVNAVCAEANLPAVRVETLRPNASSGSTSMVKAEEGARVIIIDNLQPRDMFSAELAERLRMHLAAGQRVILTMVRIPAALIDFIRTHAPESTAIDAVFVRPLKDAEFLAFSSAHCGSRNIQLDARASDHLFQLSGGVVGFAASIINNALGSFLATPSPRRTLSDKIEVLRPIVLGAAELRNGAAHLATSTRLFSRITMYFSPVEIAVLRALGVARGPLSAPQLVHRLVERFSAPDVRGALRELKELCMIQLCLGNWGATRYQLTIGAFRYWMEDMSELTSEWSSTPAPPGVPAPTQHQSEAVKIETNTQSMTPPQAETVENPTLNPTRQNLSRSKHAAMVALVDLLLGIFNDEEFRSFLRDLEGGTALLRRLPGVPAPFSSLIKQAVDIAARQGYVDSAFFQTMTAHVPRRQADIEQVARLWGFDRQGVQSEGREGTLFMERLTVRPNTNTDVCISYDEGDWSDVQKIAGKFHRVGLRAVLDAWENGADGRSYGRLQDDYRRSHAGVLVLSQRSATRAWVTDLLTTTSSPGRLVWILMAGAVCPKTLVADRYVRVSDPESCEDELKQVAQLIRQLGE